MPLLARFLTYSLYRCMLIGAVLVASIANAQEQKFVVGSAVNVRTGAGLSFTVLGKVRSGESVTVVETVGSWVQISMPERVSGGWIRADFLASAPPPLLSTPPAAPARRTVSAPSTPELTKAKNDIIRQSIDSYPGSCPCPFNSDRAGRRCGDRSAWSRQGGYVPMCYDSDVSQSRLDSYFARRRGAVN